MPCNGHGGYRRVLNAEYGAALREAQQNPLTP
jgi:hypothetical protein